MRSVRSSSAVSLTARRRLLNDNRRRLSPRATETL